MVLTSIHTKNSLITMLLDVRPVLFMADGTEYGLPVVHLVKAGTPTVNVNNALERAPAEIREHGSDFGSAEIRYVYEVSMEISGFIGLLNTAKSLTFTNMFPPPISS